MEGEHHQTRHLSASPPPPPPPSAAIEAAGPSTSSPSSASQIYQGSEEAEQHVQEENQDQPNSRRRRRRHHHHHRHHAHEQQRRLNASQRFNIAITDSAPGDMRDDIWSCLVVLVTFWFFASLTLILGFYGSVELDLGPNCSRLISANPFFIQSIKVQQIEDQTPGPMFYGFHKSPSLDIETTWSETHSVSVQPNFPKEWVYYLNAGSKVNISYAVKYPTSAPLSLVIAQGRESLVDWMDDPSYPNTTLSWSIICGSGSIEQEITESATHYIAVGNLNSESVEVQLNFTVEALLYNTSEAYFKCSVSNHMCSFSLFLLKPNAAVLTSPGPSQAKADDNRYVKLSYGPRWLTYFIASGLMTVFILVLLRVGNMFQASQSGGIAYEAEETGQDGRQPLLSPKDDDLSSWGSSYDSVSQDEDDFEERHLVQEEGKLPKEGDQATNNPRRLCIICFDAPRDSFFLPCGHCAACFTCGSKIAEEAGTCPICRRKMKKVRKIFSV